MPSCDAGGAWGAVQAHPASNEVLVHNRAANKCCYMGKRHAEDKVPLGECARAQEGKNGVRPTSRTFRIILIFPVKCTTQCASTANEGNSGDEMAS